MSLKLVRNGPVVESPYLQASTQVTVSVGHLCPEMQANEIQYSL